MKKRKYLIHILILFVIVLISQIYLVKADDNSVTFPSDGTPTEQNEYLTNNPEDATSLIESGDSDSAHIIKTNKDLLLRHAKDILIKAQSDPTILYNFVGKHKYLQQAEPELYKQIDWSKDSVKPFAKAAAQDVNFINSLSSSDKLDYFLDLLGTGKVWEYGMVYIRALLGDVTNGLIDSVDLGSVSPIDLQGALNYQGYDVTFDYPQGTDIKIENGQLIINGNTIDLEKLKTGSYDITVDPDGTVHIEDKIISDAAKNYINSIGTL